MMLASLVLAANVVLMNPFALKPDEEARFLSRWNEVAAYMQKQPGFVATKLHRGLKDQTQWFNYAEWRSAEDFQKAVQSEEFRKLTKDFPGEGRPALYDVRVKLP
jgi:heme oxygenase (mycobilin-producing)